MVELKSTRYATARRLVEAAAKGITPIKTVLDTPPTYANGTVNANSTIIGSATADAPVYLAKNPLYCTPIGVPLLSIFLDRMRPQGFQDIPANNRRLSAHGAGIRFATYADIVGIVGDFRGDPWTVYVTDVATGVRARIDTADYDVITGLAEHKLTFAARAHRIFEVYGYNNAVYFTGVNVATTDSVWAVPAPESASIGILWDSWGFGVGNSSTNGTKLGVTDFLGERLGIANPVSLSVPGSGFLATNSAAVLTYRARIEAGDFDVSRIGALDVVFMPGSLNDVVMVGNTEAATKAEAKLAIAALRVAQPNAILIGAGPQFTPATQTASTWFDAHEEAWDEAGDADCIYLDNSANGQNWMFGTDSTGINSIIFTGSQNHVDDDGMSYVGYRIADAILAAVRAAYTV